MGACVVKSMFPPSGVEPRRSAQLTSMRDLCHIRAQTKNEPFQALLMGELLDGKAESPLEPRWSGLTVGCRMWTDGFSSAVYVRGALVLAVVK